MMKMSKMHKRVLGALALSAAIPAQAQTTARNDAPELQTVTVTAQRRTENIREVPVSVTALKGEKLDVLVSGGEDAATAIPISTPSLRSRSRWSTTTWCRKIRS